MSYWRAVWVAVDRDSGNTEADDHDVLTFWGITDGFDSQLALDPDTPLATVDDEQPSDIGAVTTVGDLAIGVCQVHLL